MAALDSTPSRFLNLPAELRNVIYSELLIVRGRPITLYDDQTGREPSPGLCPAILRVSRQIYKESTWILYDCNAFLLKLTTEFNLHKTCPCPVGHHIYQRPGLPTPPIDDLFRIKNNSTGEEQGIIYPHCFRRLRHIGLVTAGDAVRGVMQTAPHFSAAYRLIIAILECLAAPGDFDWALGALEQNHAEAEMMKKPASTQAETLPSRSKSLDFVMLHPELVTSSSRNYTELCKMDKMTNLLAEVESVRDVCSKDMDVCM